MENTFLQLLNRYRRRERPDYDKMSREDLIEYIDKTLDEFSDTQKQLERFRKAVLETVQISYRENYRKKQPFSFELLEGHVKYYPKSNTFIFTPNYSLLKLMDPNSSDLKLKQKMGSRFYKFLEFSFRVESDIITMKNLSLNIKLKNKKENKKGD